MVIYHIIDYLQDQEGFKGMGFVIKKIVVHSEPTRVRGGEAHYNMIREKWDVRNLLEVWSFVIYFIELIWHLFKQTNLLYLFVFDMSVP